MQYQQQVPLPNATTVLVTGIIGIVGIFAYFLPGFACSVIAIVLSGRDQKLYNENPYKYTPESLKQLRTGRNLAIAGLVLCFCGFLFLVWAVAGR